jgi:hypothetical protein
MEYAQCRQCGSPVIWTRSVTTQFLMCLDAEPVVDGTIAILTGAAVVMRGDLFEEKIDGPRYGYHQCQRKEKP